MSDYFENEDFDNIEKTPSDIDGIIGTLKSFMENTDNLPGLVRIASCPSWFNDVYWFSEVEIRIQDHLVSTREENSGSNFEELIDKVAVNHLKKDFQDLYDFIREGEGERLTLQNSLYPFEEDEVITFLKKDNRYFITIHHSNGWTDDAWELVEKEGEPALYYYKGTELGENINDNDMTPLPSREQGIIIVKNQDCKL